MAGYDGNLAVVAEPPSGSLLHLGNLAMPASQTIDPDPPVITNVIPADGTALAAKTTPVSFDVYDLTPGPRLIVIHITYASSAQVYVVHDGTAFVGLFAATSSRTGAGTLASPYHYSILPAGGWPADIADLQVLAVDAAGNLAS